MLKLPGVKGPYGKSCASCKQVTEYIPLYRCSGGEHTVCNTCYVKQSKEGAVCLECRAIITKAEKDKHSYKVHSKSNITIEELFQLSKDQVHNLLNNKHPYQGEKEDHDIILQNVQDRHNQQLAEPLKCPHYPCGKTINVMSLKSHFTYEHPEIKTHDIRRGEQLIINSNLSFITHNTTKCMCLIKLYEEYKVVRRTTNGAYQRINKRVDLATIWVLVTGSRRIQKSKAFAVYWLVTDSDTPFKSTIDLASASNGTSCSIFCEVNDIREELSVQQVIQKLNCLYLCYGSLSNLKGELGKVHLSITIH